MERSAEEAKLMYAKQMRAYVQALLEGVLREISDVRAPDPPSPNASSPPSRAAWWRYYLRLEDPL